ncbi:MAG: ABC transporter permease [Planctomycetes bacterium]|nr:ABC transporter permease [Planctomycetota bacterium]
MNGSLLLRELRRLLPLSLVALSVSGFIALASSVLRLLGGRGFVLDSREMLPVVLGLAILIGPWLIGAATFAPERESGASTFLARLPLPGWKLLLCRLVASLVATAAVLVPIWGVAYWLQASQTSVQTLQALTLFSTFHLLSAWFTSLSFRSSLSALVAAPFLLGGVSFALSVPWRLAAHRGLSVEFLLLCMGSLVIGAFVALGLAHRGQRSLAGRHPLRATWRPVLALLLANASVAGAAAIVDYGERLPWGGAVYEAPGGVRGTTVTWSSRRARLGEVRVVFASVNAVAWLPKGQRLRSLSRSRAYTVSIGALDEPGYVWNLDDLRWAPATAPIETPLTSSARGGAAVIDHMGRGPLGFVHCRVVWVGNSPLEVGASRLLEHGSAHNLPTGWQVRASAGDLVVALAPEDEVRLFPLSRSRLPLLNSPEAWTDPREIFTSLELVLDVVPSHSGETLIAYGRDSEGWVLVGIDLAEPMSEEVIQRFMSRPLLPPEKTGPTGGRYSVSVAYFADNAQTGETHLTWEPKTRKTAEPDLWQSMGTPTLRVTPQEGYFTFEGELRYGNASHHVRAKVP